MGEVWGDFHFAPNRPKKRRGHFKYDFGLTFALLDNDIQWEIRPYIYIHVYTVCLWSRRSSGRIRQKKNISFSRRQCVAPIALMDKPPLSAALHQAGLYGRVLKTGAHFLS